MDIAYLAVLEQKLQDPENFHTVLTELLKTINRILENPYNNESRKIRSEKLKIFTAMEEFASYLKFIGFCLDEKENEFIYPKENPLTNLSKAKEAIERKIYLCYGSVPSLENRGKICANEEKDSPKKETPKLYPVKVLTTRNELLLKLQDLFNMVLQYEDSALQEMARSVIPIDKLRVLAVKRMREYQKKIKEDGFKDEDLSFDTALLMELLVWFKHKFFTWVDRPPCSQCNGPTTATGTIVKNRDGENCRVELYKCPTCSQVTEFPRYNNPATLLRTRRGRCGEWANCFTLLCRALRYEARYVYDTTDHVWCEIFDIETNEWVHVDPCEASMDAPLLYSHGWGKQLSYVIAFSCDDLQDVTWRYTTKHKEVLKRRNLCTEAEMVWAIQTLRNERQKALSEARRKYLNNRFLKEVIELMVEREPNEQETSGRISGSAEWRQARGEARPYVYNLTSAGSYSVEYSAVNDLYRVIDSNGKLSEVKGWREGAYESKSIFRKFEHDWNMVYLAREEGTNEGSITWKWKADSGLSIKTVSIRAVTQLYNSGAVTWTLGCDGGERQISVDSETPNELAVDCKELTLTACLRGGAGSTAWQHAQLCRQSAQDSAQSLQVDSIMKVAQNDGPKPC